MKKIILASKSPRRNELLTLAGLEHEVIPSDCDEDISANAPEDLVMQLSDLKCSDVADKIMKGEVVPGSASDNGYFVVGADTIVDYDGQILGKPRDEEDAFRILSMLSGNTHTVYTGVTVTDTETGRKETFYEQTTVRFINADEADLWAYIKTGDPLDKAGSYGVQGLGAFLVEGICGDYFNVVGLPLSRLIKVLKSFDC